MLEIVDRDRQTFAYGGVINLVMRKFNGQAYPEGIPPSIPKLLIGETQIAFSIDDPIFVQRPLIHEDRTKAPRYRISIPLTQTVVEGIKRGFLLETNNEILLLNNYDSNNTELKVGLLVLDMAALDSMTLNAKRVISRIQGLAELLNLLTKDTV